MFLQYEHLTICSIKFMFKTIEIPKELKEKLTLLKKYYEFTKDMENMLNAKYDEHYINFETAEYNNNYWMIYESLVDSKLTDKNGNEFRIKFEKALVENIQIVYEEEMIKIIKKWEDIAYEKRGALTSMKFGI